MSLVIYTINHMFILYMEPYHSMKHNNFLTRRIKSGKFLFKCECCGYKKTAAADEEDKKVCNECVRKSKEIEVWV